MKTDIKDVLTWMGFHVYHYWGVPHKDDAGNVVMVCYGCGLSRKVKASL